MFADFRTEEKCDWLHVNGVGYSGKGLDFVDPLQGMVPTTRILLSADRNTEEKGCRKEAVEAEWNNWTCTLSGAACTNFSSVYPTDACMTLYSDENDVDGDGLHHSGHPLWGGNIDWRLGEE